MLTPLCFNRFDTLQRVFRFHMYILKNNEIFPIASLEILAKMNEHNI